MACRLLFVLLSALHSISAGPLETQDAACSASLQRNIYSSVYENQHELHEVYKSLVRCPNTTSLSLKFDRPAGSPFRTISNFKFLAGDHFPQLRELSLDGYDFSDLRYVSEEKKASQVQTQVMMRPMLYSYGEAIAVPPSQAAYVPGANLHDWKSAMDWSAMQSLKLSNVDNAFFWMMAGRLPALKALTVSNNYGLSSATEYMTDFITSLNPLTNLSTDGYTGSVDWSRVLERHGKSLNSLTIHEWYYTDPKTLTPKLSVPQLKEISRQCPNLSELSLNIDTETERLYDILDTLSSSSNLKKLTIWLRETSRTDYPDPGKSEDMGPLNENTVPDLPFINSQTAFQIFNHLRSRKQHPELLQLEVRIGNYGLGYDEVRPSWLWWVGPYDPFSSKHTCSILNQEGNRKAEGEAWCECVGTCTWADFEATYEDY